MKEITMKEITIKACLENISVVTDFIDEQLEELNCPIKAQTQINIAIDELFGNIVNYAYSPKEGEAIVRIEIEKNPLSVIITFIDNGVPFDPLSAKIPDISLSAEERDVGGLGIFLVRKSMNEISYEYKNGHNILKIKKNIE